MYCPNCGSQNQDGVNNCSNCGASLNNTNPINNQMPNGGAKSKIVAGILGILIGSLGIHNFYLGYKRNAIIQLCLGLGGFLTCGITSLASAIWGLIEGIQILIGKIATDGNGNPLTD